MKIKSIEKIENTSKLYDIEVEKTHCFFANDILIHNSSATFFIYDNKFGIASRNLNLKENDKNSFWKVARELDIETKMREYIKIHGIKALTIQGELIGEGIQKNKYKIKGQTVKFFRVFNPIEYQFVPYIFALETIKEMGLESVPIIDDNFVLPKNYEDLIEYANGRSMLRETAREGIVFVADQIINTNARPLEDYQGRLSFKVISNKFILKHDS